MPRTITLEYAPTRAKLLLLADAAPNTRTDCTYRECIVGSVLAEKMDADQWEELTREYNSTAIDAIIGDGDAPMTFELRVDEQETVNLLSEAQSLQDTGARWGDVAGWIRTEYPEER